MGSRLHGNDGGRRHTYVVIPAQAGIHCGEAAMGSRLHGNDGERRHTHIVIPAQAGIHGGWRRRWVPVSTGTTVSGGTPMSSFPRRRESTAGGGGDGFPSPRKRRWAAAHLCRHSRAGGNPRRVEAAMGSRLHGNDGERRRTYVVIPAQAGIHGGWRRRWVPVSTGTTVGGGAPMSSLPRRRESTAGGGGATASQRPSRPGQLSRTAGSA